ncbi:MAG: hypothetical protein CM1200mP30_29960 [Pseudomonadota bacterium]|nr:MAG: hypothetical protein CM1200mP30_29960 [Pseudomonadota bacterium]
MKWQNMIHKGYLYLISCACSFGFITTLAKISYNEGAHPIPWFFFVSFYMSNKGDMVFLDWHKIKSRKKTKEQVVFNSPLRLKIVVPGNLCFSNESGIFRFCKVIPVSLSVLLFFTFPFWVLIINFIIDRDIPKLHKLFAFIIHFLDLPKPGTYLGCT